MATQAPSFKPARDPWTAIYAAIEKSMNVGTLRPTQLRFGKYGLEKRRALGLALALAISVSVWFVVSSRYSGSIAHKVDLPYGTIDRDEFHKVSIAAIDERTEPHIVVEGYVLEASYNSEETALSFKLVESLTRRTPFIVCEIISPIKLSLPPVSSRVRVYGVSRYDGQADHQWYEVHPVMKIEAID